MSSPKQETTGVTARQTMRGHTHWIRGVVHLPGGQRTVTCSLDGSLRLWDLESGGQIGDEWRDGETAVYAIAVSPTGKTIASGSDDGTVRLWEVETGQVITRWTGHSEGVVSVCWSGDGERVMSGSRDGTVREWKGETILEPISTGHESVLAVAYSPDSTRIATSGYNLQESIKIWDGKTGELVHSIKLPFTVHSLAWTSDNNKLISGSYRSIRIFNTATWEQTAILEGHDNQVNAISLSKSGRLLASASRDKTARLWNLDTNLQIGFPLQHENVVPCAAFSVDSKVLVTGCEDSNSYAWDTQAILKQAGLEELLSSSATPARPAPAPSLWSPRALFARLLSFFRRSHSNTGPHEPAQQ